MRVLFAGTPDFAVGCMERVAADHGLVAVLTQPDRPVGRKRTLQSPPVADAAREMGLPVLAPESASDDAFLAEFAALSPDLVAVVAYGQLVPQRFLDIPTHGAINLHFSLLPTYRGASPVQAALADGRTTTGVTVFRLVKRMDAGPVLATREVEVGPGETAGALLGRLAGIGAQLLSETIAAIGAGTAEGREQDEADATYCSMIRKADGVVDWTRPALALRHHWQAMTPWPGAFTWVHREGAKRPERVVLTRVREAAEGAGDEAGDAGVSAAPGVVIRADAEGIVVATGKGVLLVDSIQKEGKRDLDAGEFLRGTPLVPGDRLGSIDA